MTWYAHIISQQGRARPRAALRRMEISRSVKERTARPTQQACPRPFAHRRYHPRIMASCFPIERQQSPFQLAMKARIRPILHRSHIAVVHRVPMEVIHMPVKSSSSRMSCSQNRRHRHLGTSIARHADILSSTNGADTRPTLATDPETQVSSQSTGTSLQRTGQFRKSRRGQIPPSTSIATGMGTHPVRAPATICHIA